MTANRFAILALLTVVGTSGGAALAQPPDQPAPPPQDQYTQPPDQAAQPPDQYAQPPDQYAQASDPYASAPADGQVDINYFYDNLSSYGHWVQRGNYGWVWLPFGIRAGWRPYTEGHWVMSDYGWTWVSDERFGWATYHYGRWVDDPDYGWAWVPGYDWGPAWVAWRNGGGYIGWAPLPPEVGFRVGVGLDFGGFNLEVGLAPTHFSFVEERSFLEPRIATYIAPPARNVTIIKNTTNLTNYTVVNNRVVNQGIPVQHVEQVTGRRVQTYQVAAVTSGSARNPQVRGNQLTVFRPNVVKRAATTSPPPPPASTRGASSPTALARQHQQEVQDLQKSQAAERSRLQQIHQTELQTSQRSSANQQAAHQQQAAQQQQQAQGQRQAQDQRQQAAANSQALQQRHQAEVQAQQAQHQREQQQLQARHQAEQTQARPPAAQHPPPPKQEQKRPANPPPPAR